MSQVLVDLVGQIVYVFEFLGLFVDIFGRHTGMLREIRFPEAVGANHLYGPPLACGGELDLVLLSRQQSLFLELAGKPGDSPRGDPDQRSEVVQVAPATPLLGVAIDRLEDIFTLDMPSHAAPLQYLCQQSLGGTQ